MSVRRGTIHSIPEVAVGWQNAARLGVVGSLVLLRLTEDEVTPRKCGSAKV